MNEFVNRDDYVGFLSSDPDPIEFLSPDSELESVIDTTGDAIVKITLTLSANKHIYERSVYTFFNLLGDVGGFNAAIIILPTFLMAIYNERMFQSSI